VKAIILAAGYATRLYPLTKNFPKPLLRVGDRTILDLLVDQLDDLPHLREIILVTNSRFLPFFEQWREGRRAHKPVSLLDDGSTSNANRLGALGDLRLAMQGSDLGDDLLVTAADNILRFALGEFVAAFHSHRAPHICVHRVEDRQRLRRTGVAELDAEDHVVGFSEKPDDPKSHWAVPPLYIFPQDVLPRILARLSAGGPKDAPGHLIEWLCLEENVFAHRIRGSILDIGTPESLEAARGLIQETDTQRP